MHEKILKEFADKCKEKLGKNLISIVLFGSYVRGNFSKYSDIDLLIIAERLPLPHKRQEIIRDIQEKIIEKDKKKISCVFFTRKEFEHAIINENPLLYGILTGYEEIFDKNDYFKKWITIFKNRLKITKPIYREGDKKWELAKIV